MQGQRSNPNALGCERKLQKGRKMAAKPSHLTSRSDSSFAASMKEKKIPNSSKINIAKDAWSDYTSGLA
jgi:hypothetical protein